MAIYSEIFDEIETLVRAAKSRTNEKKWNLALDEIQSATFELNKLQNLFLLEVEYEEQESSEIAGDTI